MSKPLVSIIMPSYNRGYMIESAIESVLAQSFGQWELLIIDNSSTDNTVDIIKSKTDKRIRLFNTNNFGIVNKSRNIGLENARGEFIALLDTDDSWEPQKLRKSLDELQKGVDVVYHDLFLIKNKNLTKSILPTWTMHAPIKSDLLERGNAINNTSAVIRKKVLVAAGGFCEIESLNGWEDYGTWLSVSEKTNKFSRIEGVLGSYTISPDSVSAPQRSIKAANYISEKYFNDDVLPNWLSYSIASSSFQTWDFLTAYRHSKSVIVNFWSGIPSPKVFAIFILSLFFIPFCFFFPKKDKNVSC